MKWLADENFRNSIIRGLVRQSPRFDIVRAQDQPEIAGADDPEMLAWATGNERIVLTHDLSTMVAARAEQVRRAEVCAPVVLVSDSVQVWVAVQDILLLDACSLESDWAPGIIYLPIR